MSGSLERPTRTPTREVTPKVDRQDLFDFLEDKWKGREEGPRTLSLRLAFGPGGGTWREDVIHEKEFKKNNDQPPTRPEIAEIANLFYGAMTRHCDELGKPQGYVVLALNPTKGSRPYGIHYIKLRPTPGLAIPSGNGHDFEENGVLSDGEHRDLMLKESLSHVKESNEHVRFMSDANHRYTGQVLAMQQEIIRQQQETINAYKSQDIERIKILEELFSKRHERDIEKEKHQMYMGLATGAVGLIGQMVPSFQKALEAKSNRPAEIEGSGPIDPTPESEAIEKFVKECDNDQRLALFGHHGQDGKHVPGILTSAQVDLLGQVGGLQKRYTELAALMTGGPHEITIAQIMQMIQVVPQERLLALKAVILDGRRTAVPPTPQAQQQEAQP